MKRAIPLAFGAGLAGAWLMSVCWGSVDIPLGDTLRVLWNALLGRPIPQGLPGAILLDVRLPRPLCVALVGAALSLAGAAMQGLLRNPLADGSTLGVASGASLGAVLAIALGVQLPGLPIGGTAAMAILFAFLSLLLILGLAARLDGGLATQTVILLGVMFSMLATSLTSLVSLLFPEKLRSITFWTMGSLQGSDYAQAALLAAALALAGGTLYFTARELNAFTLGEEQAGNLGVNVRSCKLRVLFCVAALTGVSVAVGGGIGFVGLLVPHMTRRLLGPDHSRLLPGAACFGATFLLLADLLSRVLLRPLELPVGAVTSLVGAGAFVYIFYTTRRKNQGC